VAAKPRATKARTAYDFPLSGRIAAPSAAAETCPTLKIMS